jgi:hypothetical protein
LIRPEAHVIVGRSGVQCRKTCGIRMRCSGKIGWRREQPGFL